MREFCIIVLFIFGLPIFGTTFGIGNSFKDTRDLISKIAKNNNWKKEELIFIKADLGTPKNKASFILSKNSCGRGICKVYLIENQNKNHVIIGVFENKPIVLDTKSNNKYDLLINLNQGDRKEFESIGLKYTFNGSEYERVNK